MKDSEFPANAAAQLHKQENELTFENMDSLETQNMGQAVLTLEEALCNFEMNQESCLF